MTIEPTKTSDGLPLHGMGIPISNKAIQIHYHISLTSAQEGNNLAVLFHKISF